MYYVKASGENLKELKKAVAKIYAELGGDITGEGSIEYKKTPSKPKVVVEETVNDDYEEVESPFVNTPPILNEDIPVVQAAPLAFTGSFTVDSEGLPWDERIHSSSKALNTNGTWRTRRKIDDSLYNRVRNELLNGRSAQVSAPQAAPYTPPVQHTPPVQQPVQQPVASPVLPPMMNINSGHTVDSFVKNFPMVLGTLITEGKIDQNYVNALNAHFGVQQIIMITDEQKAQLFPLFVDAGIIKKVG